MVEKERSMIHIEQVSKQVENFRSWEGKVR